MNNIKDLNLIADSIKRMCKIILHIWTVNKEKVTAAAEIICSLDGTQKGVAG